MPSSDEPENSGTEARRAWIRKSLTRWRKARYAISAFFRRVLPGLTGIDTWRAWAIAGLRFLFTLAIASTPFWFSYISDRAGFDFCFALKATLALALLMFLATLIDLLWLRGRKDKKTLDLRKQVAAMESNLHKTMAGLINPADHVQGVAEEKILSRILAVMTDAARAHLKIFEDTELQATLFLFSDKSLDRFLCRARARADRETGHTVLCDESIAWHWMEWFPDRASSVHDITKQSVFPHRLSDGARGVSYRSILILPLTIRDGSTGSHAVRGVITLDSRRSYEFWGSRRQELESLLEPHISWILAITSDHPHIRKVPRSA